MNLGDATLTGSTKDMLHAMVEFGRDIITLFDGKGVVVFSSSSHRSILGYDAIDIFTTKAIELIHPDDRDTIINNFYELLTHPSVRFSCHWRQQHSDGHYIWMEGTGINKLEDPNIRAIICN
ncbi:MAG: PAS domain-containing protein, partial [Bacteroidetes bacterium]|nr:PAS domain-containing protein [Bacteroidota bacterium]